MRLIIVAGGASVAADIEQAIQKADASDAHPVPAAAPEGAYPDIVLRISINSDHQIAGEAVRPVGIMAEVLKT